MNNPPAFPLHNHGAQTLGLHVTGMSLRDYMAAAALQGLLANPKLQQQILKEGGAHGGWIESSAWAFADAMMKARDGKG
jgi:hypothetical protein